MTLTRIDENGFGRTMIEDGHPSILQESTNCSRLRLREWIGPASAGVCAFITHGVVCPVITSAAIKKITEGDPHDSGAHELPVSSYLESHDYQDATEAHKRVMRTRTKSNASAHLMLGDGARSDPDRHEGASESCNTVARSNPDSFEAHDNLANAYIWLERCEDAIAFLEEVTRTIADD